MRTIFNHKHKKIISAILLASFIFSNAQILMAFDDMPRANSTLAPTSRFKPISYIRDADNGKLEIVEDPEAVSRFQKDGPLKDFAEFATYRYLDNLIREATHINLSETGLKSLIAKHLSNTNINLDLTGFKYYKRGDSFYLLSETDGKKSEQRYFLTYDRVVGVEDLLQKIPANRQSTAGKVDTEEEAPSQIFDTFEEGVYKALERYSNIHRGSGQNAIITSMLYDSARGVFLEYFGLDEKDHTVVFGTRRQLGLLKEFIISEGPKGHKHEFHERYSDEIGLPLGVGAIAIQKNNLPDAYKEPPYVGGGTVQKVHPLWVHWANPPEKFEAGTPNIMGVIAFARAIRMMKHSDAANLFEVKTSQDSVDDIFYRDMFSEFSGAELLSKLKDSIIGNGLTVPTERGESTYINFDNAASTSALLPVWEAVRKVWRLPKEKYKSVIREGEKICRSFLNASENEYDVVFTSNATEGINLAARLIQAKHKQDVPDDVIEDARDNVIINTVLEHNSNELPWRYVTPDWSRKWLGVDDEGFFDFNELEKILKEYKLRERDHGTKPVRIVSVSGASNVLGSLNDIKKICEIAHKYGAQVLVDAAQLAAHRKIDMEDMGADYLVFSGHKMYAPFGSGALVIRKSALDLNREDVESLKSDGEENVVGIAAMAKAMELLSRVGMDRVAEDERRLTEYALKALSSVPGIKVAGIKDSASPGFLQKAGVISIFVDRMSQHFVAKILGESFGIGVRSGCFCAHILVKGIVNKLGYAEQVLMDSLIGEEALVRLSFGLCNSFEEIDRLISALSSITQKGMAGLKDEFDMYMGNKKTPTGEKIHDFAADILKDVYLTEKSSPERSSTSGIGDSEEVNLLCNALNAHFKQDEGIVKKEEIDGIEFTISETANYVRSGNFVFIPPSIYEALPGGLKIQGEKYLSVIDLGQTWIVPTRTFPYGIFTHMPILILQARPELVKGKTVLDIGAGDGILAIVAAKLGAKKVIAIDNNSERISEARENVDRNGVSAIVEITEKDCDLIAEDEFGDVGTVIANLSDETVFGEDLRRNIHVDLLKKFPNISAYLACGLATDQYGGLAADRTKAALTRAGYKFDEIYSGITDQIKHTKAGNFIVYPQQSAAEVVQRNDRRSTSGLDSDDFEQSLKDLSGAYGISWLVKNGEYSWEGPRLVLKGPGAGKLWGECGTFAEIAGDRLYSAGIDAWLFPPVLTGKEVRSGPGEHAIWTSVSQAHVIIVTDDKKVIAPAPLDRFIIGKRLIAPLDEIYPLKGIFESQWRRLFKPVSPLNGRTQSVFFDLGGMLDEGRPNYCFILPLWTERKDVDSAINGEIGISIVRDELTRKLDYIFFYRTTLSKYSGSVFSYQTPVVIEFIVRVPVEELTRLKPFLRALIDSDNPETQLTGLQKNPNFLTRLSLYCDTGNVEARQKLFEMVGKSQSNFNTFLSFMRNIPSLSSPELEERVTLKRWQIDFKKNGAEDPSGDQVTIPGYIPPSNDGRRSTNGGDAEVVAKIEDILRDWSRRPEPAEVMGFSAENIGKAVRGAFPEVIDGKAVIDNITGSLMFMEAQNVLPHVKMLVEHILRYYPRHKILICGRDAEIFYDALKIVLRDTQYEKDIMLFPGSSNFMSTLLYLDKNHPALASWQKEFLEMFSITPEAIKQGQKFLVLDTGFRGTIGERLHEVVGKVYGAELDSSLIYDALDIRLVGLYGAYAYVVSVRPYGSQLMPILADKDDLVAEFPRTLRVVEKPRGNEWEPDFFLGSVLQLLPKHHGPYYYLTRDESGALSALPLESLNIGWNFDGPQHINDSVVNPIAALLVQRRVAEYFDDNRADILAAADMALRHSTSGVLRIGSLPAPAVVSSRPKESGVGLPWQEQPAGQGSPDFTSSSKPQIPNYSSRRSTAGGSYKTIGNAIEALKARDLTDEEILDIRKGLLVNAENEQKLFSGLVSDIIPAVPIVEAMSRDASEDVRELVEEMRSQLERLSFPAEEIVSYVQNDIELIYRRMPEHLFRRFYADNPVVKFHALMHVFEVLRLCFEIIKNDPTISPQDVDFKALCNAAMFHDIANVVHRGHHDVNSIVWMRAILEKEKEATGKPFLTARDENKVKMIAAGHSKIIGDGVRPEHRQFVEARILHDADMLASSLNLEKIYAGWIEWTEEETGQQKKFVNKFYMPELTIEARLNALIQDNYAHTDGITDLARQAWVRRDPKNYLTSGGKAIAASSGMSLEVVTSFIDSKRQHLKEFYHSTEQDIDNINTILADLYKTFIDVTGAGEAVDASRRTMSGVKLPPKELKICLAEDMPFYMRIEHILSEIERLKEIQKLQSPLPESVMTVLRHPETSQWPTNINPQVISGISAFCRSKDFSTMSGPAAEFRDEFRLPPRVGYTKYYGGISNLLSWAAWNMAGIKRESPMGEKMADIWYSDFNGFIAGPGRLNEEPYGEAARRIEKALDQDSALLEAYINVVANLTNIYSVDIRNRCIIQKNSGVYLGMGDEHEYEFLYDMIMFLNEYFPELSTRDISIKDITAKYYRAAQGLQYNHFYVVYPSGLKLSLGSVSTQHLAQDIYESILNSHESSKGYIKNTEIDPWYAEEAYEALSAAKSQGIKEADEIWHILRHKLVGKNRAKTGGGPKGATSIRESAAGINLVGSRELGVGRPDLVTGDKETKKKRDNVRNSTDGVDYVAEAMSEVSKWKTPLWSLEECKKFLMEDHNQIYEKEKKIINIWRLEASIIGLPENEREGLREWAEKEGVADDWIIFFDERVQGLLNPSKLRYRSRPFYKYFPVFDIWEPLYELVKDSKIKLDNKNFNIFLPGNRILPSGEDEFIKFAIEERLLGHGFDNNAVTGLDQLVTDYNNPWILRNQWALLNVMIEGFKKGDFGRFTNPACDNPFSYGPYYMIQSRELKDGKHSYLYIVPSEQDVLFLAEALKIAIQNNVITQDKATKALSRVMTYEQVSQHHQDFEDILNDENRESPRDKSIFRAPDLDMRRSTAGVLEDQRIKIHLVEAITEYQKSVAQARQVLYDKMSPLVKGKRKLSDEKFDFNFVLRDIETSAWHRMLGLEHYFDLCDMARARGVTEEGLKWQGGYSIFEQYFFGYSDAMFKVVADIEKLGLDGEKAYKVLVDGEDKSLDELANIILNSKTNDEIRWAADLADTIKLSAEEVKAKALEEGKVENQNIIIGIETEGWMSGTQRTDVEHMAREIKHVVEKMKRKGIINNDKIGDVRIVLGNSDNLADNIRSVQTELNVPVKNVAILGSKSTLVDSGKFNDFKDEALLACVEPEDIEKLDYVALFEMLTILINRAFERDTWQECRANHPDIDINYLTDEHGTIISERIIRLIPKARAIDANEAKRIYDLQIESFETQA